MPALEHNVVQGGCTALGRLHPVAVLHLVQNLGIGHACREKIRGDRSSLMTVSKITRIRDAAVGHKLGQKDAEAPDVALDAEPAVVGGLRRGPLDREPGQQGSG